MRTLRPLRFISHNLSMKLMVTALMESVTGIFNVLIVILLVWLMFAILAMNLKSGELNYCSANASLLKIDCFAVGGNWKLYDLNFDYIGSTMVTLFVISTFEGWPWYMYWFIDGTKVGPIRNNDPYFGIYFMVFIMVGSVVSVNLFVAIICINYSIAEEKSKSKYLTQL